MLARADLSTAAWAKAFQVLPSIQPLRDEEALRLRELAALFLHEKNFEAVQGLALNGFMQQVIALQACLPVLNLGIDWYRDLLAVVVYPDIFLSEISEHDESGLVHHYHEARSGEAWEHGALLLAWSEIEAGFGLVGHNVVLHEIAHVIDSANGSANGHPPLPSSMSAQAWADDLGAAFAHFSARVDDDEDTVIDPYASESPAEFFAVFTEVFFETPAVMVEEYPRVYRQFSEFYRQDPLLRMI